MKDLQARLDAVWKLYEETDALLRKAQDDAEKWQGRYLAEKQAHQATIEDYEKMTNNPY